MTGFCYSSYSQTFVSRLLRLLFNHLPFSASCPLTLFYRTAIHYSINLSLGPTLCLRVLINVFSKTCPHCLLFTVLSFSAGCLPSILFNKMAYTSSSFNFYYLLCFFTTNLALKLTFPTQPVDIFPKALCYLVVSLKVFWEFFHRLYHSKTGSQLEIHYIILKLHGEICCVMFLLPVVKIIVVTGIATRPRTKQTRSAVTDRDVGCIFIYYLF